MAFDLWLIYLVATIGLSLTPGPNGLLALSHGAMHGVKKCTFTITGGVFGFVILMAISLAGMGALLIASEQGFMIAKWLGAAYLVYLGVKTWRSPPPQVRDDTQVDTSPVKSGRALFTQGFFVAISNPKVIIFFAAFLPQFIDTSAPKMIQFVILATTFAVSEFLVELFLAGSAHKLIPWLSKGRVGIWFNRVTGSTFVGMGAVLATINRNA